MIDILHGSQARRLTPPRNRLPITAKVLEQIRMTLYQWSHPQRVLLWAVACTAFFGFFRLGEILLESPTSFNLAASLAWGDVTVDDQTTPTKVRIHLKKSKCDQFGTGADIIVGRTHSFLCPVAAIVSYMVEQGQRPGPFFIDTGGKVLTKVRFVGVIRGVLGSIGLPQHQYAGHSFRIGAATSASLDHAQY